MAAAKSSSTAAKKSSKKKVATKKVSTEPPKKSASSSKSASKGSASAGRTTPTTSTDSATGGSSGGASKKSAGSSNPTTGGHRIPGVGDLLSLVGGVGPVMVAGRAIENVVSLSTQLVEMVTTFNETLRELNTVARRVNRLLDDIEAPIRLIVPQVERGVDQARATLKRVDGVVAQVGSLPSDVARAVGTLSELASKLNPLAQFAETAGGIFGIRPPSAS